MPQLQRVTAGDFEHLGNGIFQLKSNHDIKIDVKKTMREVEQSLIEQGCETKALGGFYFQLRTKAHLIGQRGGYHAPNNQILPDRQEQTPQPIFEFERPLREWLVHEISNNKIEIRGRKVKLYRNNRDEYQTGVGNIDILTVDDEGNFYVFELKRNLGTHSAIGQVLSYMGWIQEHLANKKEVKGVIVASDIDERLKAAVRVAPNIVLLKYKLHFTMEEVNGNP